MERFFEQFPARVFLTGIDTDAGKTWAAGWLAKTLTGRGQSAITQKFIQTGNHQWSEDIEVHRQIMGCGMLPRDLDHTTAPVILSYPASADLAARIDGVEIDFQLIDRASDTLASEYSHLIIEGAGGIMVPLKGDYLAIDYVKQKGLPVIVVTNSRLGSINHTLLTLDALQTRGIPVYALVYNPHFDKDELISADTRQYLRSWLSSRFPETHFVEMPA